jgi:hypothetical protein
MDADPSYTPDPSAGWKRRAKEESPFYLYMLFTGNEKAEEYGAKVDRFREVGEIGETFLEPAKPEDYETNPYRTMPRVRSYMDPEDERGTGTVVPRVWLSDAEGRRALVNT